MSKLQDFSFLFYPRTMADDSQVVGGIHFPFPFPPYSIQKDFMAELYQVLEAGKIGIFESPTGTVSVKDEECHEDTLEAALLP